MSEDMKSYFEQSRQQMLLDNQESLRQQYLLNKDQKIFKTIKKTLELAANNGNDAIQSVK